MTEHTTESTVDPAEFAAAYAIVQRAKAERMAEARQALESSVSAVDRKLPQVGGADGCPCGWDPEDRIRDHGCGNGTRGEFLDQNGEPDYHGALDHAIAVIEDFADWQEGRSADKTLNAYRRYLGRDLRQHAGRLAVNLKAEPNGEAA
ncbi:hypothetical protein [Jongsikchunia kroppenstedtii]|uniref:hypothetical protein n=1 Tax=Jongsikchunia kroppenstedtii TaxID=1121721 RepID=UPI00035F36DC|nr:hypothetical protein [Jongsikchunia kroppenstedtii]